MEKDIDAFRTISEVAEELDLPQHVLRFWEMRFPQIKPMKRSGGRRYYRPDDVDLLRGVKRLLYGEGYTIKGVQRILKEQGVRAVSDQGRSRTESGDEAPPEVRISADGAPTLGPAAEDIEGDAAWPAEEAIATSHERLLRAALFEVEECVRILSASHQG